MNQGSATISVRFGQANGAFGARQDVPIGSSPYGLAIGDVNGDGKPDVVVANYDPNTVSVLLNTGAGSFGPKTDYGTAVHPFAVAIGDVNGDGKADIAVTTMNNSSVSVLLGLGGAFGTPTSHATASDPTDVLIVDVNGDGFRISSSPVTSPTRSRCCWEKGTERSPQRRKGRI